MRTEERNMAIRQYFMAQPARLPKYSAWLKAGIILIGLGIFINNFFKNTGFTGYILSIAGFFFIAFWFRPYLLQRKQFAGIPQTDEVSRWFVNDLHTAIKERAVQLLRLNAKQLRPENFIIVPCPVYWQIPGIPDELSIRKTIHDGLYMYATWKVQILALTRNYISFYSCIYSWMEDTIFNESTNEFYYDDISSVKNDIEHENLKMPGDEHEKSIRTFVFKVTNVSSDSFRITTGIPELKYAPELQVDMEKAVQAIRMIIRQRRFREDDSVQGRKEDAPDLD